MRTANVSGILVENTSLLSHFLEREVFTDIYIPRTIDTSTPLRLLLINDGQNLKEMGFEQILDQLYTSTSFPPLVCAAIHAGEERKLEYGVASQPDFKGRGAKAGLYTSYILQELLPLLQISLDQQSFRNIAFAGFSLGGLSALDIVWNHPQLFSIAGVFSGSLWWRSIDQADPEYKDHLHRIMHQQIRNSEYKPGLQFFLQCGNMDEVRDRNKNGIIDSIDDTRDLVAELTMKGYDPANDIKYLEMPDGKHDTATWARAMPEFLKWTFLK